MILKAYYYYLYLSIPFQYEPVISIMEPFRIRFHIFQGFENTCVLSWNLTQVDLGSFALKKDDFLK